jgi:hypothetical protein
VYVDGPACLLPFEHALTPSAAIVTPGAAPSRKRRLSSKEGCVMNSLRDYG